MEKQGDSTGDSAAAPAVALDPSDTIAAPPKLYTPRFFQVFIGVVFVMTGTAMQFHFGQYVGYLGYDEGVLGVLLSVSIIGTLLLRLHMGRWIDGLGCKPVWIAGTGVVAVAIGCMQFAQALWVLAILRGVVNLALACVMTTVAVFAAQIAPAQRRAESLGTIGLGGFVGMVIGPLLGDIVFQRDPNDPATYQLFFTLSAAMYVVGCAIMLPMEDVCSSKTRGLPEEALGDEPAVKAAPGQTPPQRPSQVRLLLDNWPGVILVVGVVFGLGFSFQSSFLERLAEARGFYKIQGFFLVYAPSAIILRLVFRRLPHQIGRTRTLILGLGLMAIGQWALASAESQWDLALPGFLMGAGHCFIFPSMVDLAAERFPVANRGTGTAVILGCGDVGMLIGFAALGTSIELFEYKTTLRMLAGTMIASALLMAWSRRSVVFGRRPVAESTSA